MSISLFLPHLCDYNHLRRFLLSGAQRVWYLCFCQLFNVTSAVCFLCGMILLGKKFNGYGLVIIFPNANDYLIF